MSAAGVSWELSFCNLKNKRENWGSALKWTCKDFNVFKPKTYPENKAMKDNGYKPLTDVIKKRFIGYKLGRISKKE